MDCHSQLTLGMERNGAVHLWALPWIKKLRMGLRDPKRLMLEKGQVQNRDSRVAVDMFQNSGFQNFRPTVIACTVAHCVFQLLLTKMPDSLLHITKVLDCNRNAVSLL